MNVYKIRDKTTGLFSQGGTTPKFSKSGKAWPSLAVLNSHLTAVVTTQQYTKRGGYHEDCEIVTFSVEEACTQSLGPLIAATILRKKKRELDYKRRCLENARNRLNKASTEANEAEQKLKREIEHLEKELFS